MKTGPMALVGKKNATLHAVALPVELNDDTLPALLQLAERMLATCRVKGGIAIAAPQVGVGKRLIVQWDGRVWINPELELDEAEMDLDTEGCLSLPGRVYAVSRASRCELKASDLSGNVGTFDLEGLEARCLQHEVDHLDGVLISDRGLELRNGGGAAVKL